MGGFSDACFQVSYSKPTSTTNMNSRISGVVKGVKGCHLLLPQKRNLNCIVYIVCLAVFVILVLRAPTQNPHLMSIRRFVTDVVGVSTDSIIIDPSAPTEEK